MVEVARSNENPLNILGQQKSDSNIQDITSPSGAEADPNIQNQDEKLGDILDQLESNRGLLDNLNDIQRIMSLLQEGADRDTQNQYGKTLSYYLDEKLFNILNELAIDRNLLGNYVQRISLLLQAGANRDTQNRYGKTLSYYLDKRLSDILESNRAPLNNIRHIILLLEAGANPNVQNREDGKTLLHYVAECNDTSGIRFLLEVIKANPNVRDQSGKTPLHYAAKNNCLQARELLLGAGANPNVQVQSGKTPPFEYATEDECRQAIKDLGYDLDDSHENEGNLATPDGSVDDCSNSSGDDSQIESVKLSDCNTEEDSNCSSSDNLCNDDKNDNEKDDKETVTNLIFEEILSDRVKPRDGTKAYIGRVNDINNQDDEDKDEALDITESITSNLLLEGGKAKEEFFSSGSDTELAQNYRSDYIRNPGEECKEIKDKLESIAYEGIVSRDRQAQNGKLEEVVIGNQCFRMKYSQDSIIEPAKILNHEKAKELNLKVGILQIGKSIVRVESIDGKRNYIDISGSIKMSFTTDAGEISIYLHHSEKDSNKIEVEIDKESEARLNKLKAEKRSLGENCLLGGKSVLDAIEDKVFEKNGSVSTETTKDDPSTGLTQVCWERKARSRS